MSVTDREIEEWLRSNRNLALRLLGLTNLPSIAVTAGEYGDGTHVPVVTVDRYGRITGVVETVITGAAPSGPAGGDLTGTFPNPTVAADAVTYAKLQNVSATQRVLGRNSAGAGDTQEVTATQVLDWLATTRGSLLYRGSGGWAGVAPGTSGNVLTSNGAGADPTYQAASAGILTLISDTTLGADTATFDIASIGGTYKHLVGEFDLQTDHATAAQRVRLRFNNDSGANYDWNLQNQVGNDVASGETSAVLSYTTPWAAGGATLSSAGRFEIPNYAGTTFYKKLRADSYEDSSATHRIEQMGISWKSTAAINRITLLFADATKFKTGSRFTLYGVN